MPIEEITLSVPKGSVQLHAVASRTSGHDDSDDATGAKKLATAYLKSTRARDRFAFTQRGRKRNRDRFNQSLKAIVKKIASDASAPVEDRTARMAVRAQVYGDVMQLIKSMSADQLRMISRTRRSFRWSLATATVGLTGVVVTLFMNDILKWPVV